MIADQQMRLRAGTRLLHIGPHKTGSTAVQGAFHLARERLAAQGVIYPGRGKQPLWPILAVTGQPALRGEPSPEMAYWERLVRDIRAAGEQHVVLSSEFFAETDDETVRRVVEDLGGADVHVVVTLRSLIRILPSQWQQYLQNGYQFRYLEWLDGILSEPPRTPTPGFWRRHRHDALVTRWVNVVGAQNLTAVVVDESDRLMLLRTFESMLGLPDGFLVPEEGAANRSLTVAEAELVRLLNAEFSRRNWPDHNYARFMRYGAVERMKTARRPAPYEPGIATPAWALTRAAEISAEMAGNISALGVNIVGDISALGRLSADLPATADPPPGGPVIPVEAAALAILGALIAGGAGGQSAEETVRDVDTRSLAKVLAKRSQRRVIKALPRLR
jgi:hypothetical protein